MDFQHLADQYRSELMDSVLPFWLEHSQDKTYGGYFSCLDRDGSVYDTDKFIWLQGREVWLFSMLCNKVEKRKEWLDCAIQGGEFLRKYGHDGKYDWYFSLTREGKPIIDPYNIFSYTFATMAFAQLAMASGNDEYAQIAKKTFDRILEKRSNPKGKWTKAHPGTRPMKDFALPMILCNLALEIEQLIDPKLIEETIDVCLHEVMDVFYQKDLGLIVENLSASDNSLVDSFEGRSINPGHSLEAMWFIMDLGKRLGRPELIQSVTATLSGIAGIFDMEKGQTIGEPTSTVFSFTRDGSKLTADTRLLGTMGAVQSMVLDIVFTDGGRTQRTEVDLTEALADFNGDMTTAYRVTGTLETPVGMEEGKGEITGWETVEGGDASAEM